MTLDQLSAAATIDLAELPEQIESLRNHADERRRRGWRMSADNLEASANIIEALAAECALYRTGQLVAVADDAVERYRHVKRGTVYEIVGEAELQTNADNLVDGSQMMVYRGEDGRLWCRHYDEFHDGRFAALAAKGTGDE